MKDFGCVLYYFIERLEYIFNDNFFQDENNNKKTNN